MINMSFIQGFVSAIIAIIIIWFLLRKKIGKFFFTRDVSLYDFDITVDKIRKRVANFPEWKITEDKDYTKIFESRDNRKLSFRLHELKLGNPEHSFKVNSEMPEVCAFMPASIVVVQKPGEEVMIFRKNTALMGEMFPGVTGQIMRENVPNELDKMLRGIRKVDIECKTCEI